VKTGSAHHAGVLIYDGTCNLCLATKAWFQQRDAENRVGFVEAQAPELLTRYPELTNLELLSEITWLDDQRGVRRGADAIASALLQIPRWGWAGRMILLPGTGWLRRAFYRWIAGNRYRWFGSAADTCEQGVCRVNPATPDHDSGGDTRDRPLGRAFPTIASILVLVAVFSPVRENWKDKKDAVDSFPLSYYPMFSRRRADTHRQPHVVGIRSNGETFPISYKLLGTGGLNQVRRQLDRLTKQDDSEPLRQMLAGAANEIGNSSKKRYRDCVALAAVRGHYDLDRYFSAGEKEPLRMSLLRSVPVPGRAPVDPSSLLSADEL
jgi:predicted DCC family thiol-disulfide oxidoreductase YuxK